jgi:hypothetical protein
MNYRKFPLLIYVKDAGAGILGKTCRYCPRCEIILVHQDELEAELEHLFSSRDPDAIGKQYMVVGTVNRGIWRQGLQLPVMLEEVREHTSDFKRYLEIHMEPNGPLSNE